MDLANFYESITLLIGEETGASESLLHVYAGMAVLLIVRVTTGRSLATPIPFAALCFFAIANEVLDRINHGMWKPDTLLDLLNTVFWPFVLMLGLRARRSRELKQARPTVLSPP